MEEQFNGSQSDSASDDGPHADPAFEGESFDDCITDYHEFYREIGAEEIQLVDPWNAMGAEKDVPCPCSPTCIGLPGLHTVRQGESLLGIAELYGILPDRIWDDDRNKELIVKRDPHVLYPGDQVYVPEKRIRVEGGATERRHRFQRRAGYAWLRLILEDSEGSPRQGVKYALRLDGVADPYEGVTTNEGLLEKRIPVSVTKAVLQLQDPSFDDGQTENFDLFIQCLDPADKISGAQARLNNLGSLLGCVDDSSTEAFKAVIATFQDENRLPVTGVLDEGTGVKLRELYGV